MITLGLTVTIKRVLKIVGLAMLVGAIPAIFVFVGSIWTVLMTAEEDRKEDALAILMEDAWFARNRQHRIASLYPDKSRHPTEMPVFDIAYPGPDAKPALTVRFPSCFDPEVIDDPEKLRRYRAAGYPFLFRLRQVEDERNLLLARQLGVVRLALLKSCLAATPFSNSCGVWLDDQSVDDEAVAAALKEKKHLEIFDDRLCWPQRELAAPTAIEEYDRLSSRVSSD